MHKGRLEAFSDAVIAIIMTIMVLDLRVPKGDRLGAMLEVWPTFACYILSFVYLGIYWNNHHHTLQRVKEVNGPVLWANMHLLFWLSLIPFSTDWLGAHLGSEWPVALYGGILLMCSIAYYFLVQALIAANGKDSQLAKAVGSDYKGKVSSIIYTLGIAATWWQPAVSCALYLVVALIWFIPDPRLEEI